MRRTRLTPRFAPRFENLEVRIALSGIDPTDPVDVPPPDPGDGSLHIIAPTPPPDPHGPLVA